MESELLRPPQRIHAEVMAVLCDDFRDYESFGTINIGFSYSKSVIGRRYLPPNFPIMKFETNVQVIIPIYTH